MKKVLTTFSHPCKFLFYLLLVEDKEGKIKIWKHYPLFSLKQFFFFKRFFFGAVSKLSQYRTSV